MQFILCLIMVTAAAEDPPPTNLLVAVTAEWCEPCQRMKPSLLAMRRDGWNVRIIDYDRYRNHPWMVLHVAGRPVPCFVMCLDDSGRRVWQIATGTRSRTWLEQWIIAAGRKMKQ